MALVLSPTQAGSSTVSAWSESVIALSALTTAVGFQFTTNDPAAALRGLTLNLTVTAPQSGTLTFRLRVEADPGEFSNSNLPQGGTSGLVVTSVDPFATATTASVVFNLQAAVTEGALGTSFDTVLSRLRRGDWAGRYAISITHDLTGGDSLVFDTSAVTLSVDAEGALTGLDGPMWKSSRPDFCPRCGQVSLRETWVRDGVTKTLVCPDCYDPPDLSRHRRPRKPRRLINEN